MISRQVAKFSTRNLRVTTFNTLNTKDRYVEREPWLKENIYSFNSDVVGLQECVYGPRSLDELTNVDPSKPQRHVLEQREDRPLRNYNVHLAPVQLQLFEIWRDQPDPEARLDGNSMLTDKKRFGEGSGSEFQILSNEVLHISGVRNCQMMSIKDTCAPKGRPDSFIMINLHLHNPMEEISKGDYLRSHQATHFLHWLGIKQKELQTDRVFIFGDFNAEPDQGTIHLMKDQGFKSAYEQVHGHEPEVPTFHNGIQAPHADRDPPAVLDYVFFRGEGIEIDHCKLAGD